MLRTDQDLIRAECELQNVERRFVEQARIVSKFRVGSYAAHIREAALARLKDDIDVKRQDCFRLLTNPMGSTQQNNGR